RLARSTNAGFGSARTSCTYGWRDSKYGRYSYRSSVLFNAVVGRSTRVAALSRSSSSPRCHAMFHVSAHAPTRTASKTRKTRTRRIGREDSGRLRSPIVACAALLTRFDTPENGRGEGSTGG